MKRTLLMLSTIATLAFVAGCEKGPTPDGLCALKNITLTKALNPSLASDLTGKIEGYTVTFNIPTDAIGSNLIPTFTVSEYDVVKIGGVQAESGVTSCKLDSGTKIEVSDDVSNLAESYTVTVNENDGEAVLLSLAISKSSELSIAEDIKASEISEEMVLRVPGSAFQKSLVVKATAGSNDVIKINGEVAEDGTATVDTKFPIDIEVVDEFAGAKQSYVLKVGKILDIVVVPVATGYTEGTIGTMNMAVNPVDNAPYIIYVRKNEGDAKKGLSVAKFEKGAFTLVGSASVSANETNDASCPVISFKSDGTPYALYIGGEVKNQNTLKKWNGTDWELVGTAGIQGGNITASYGDPLALFQPGDNVPAIFSTGNVRGTTTYRAMGMSSLTGETWNTVVPSQFPAYGTPTASAGMYYGGKAAYAGNSAYMVSAFNQYGFYVSEFTGNGTCNIIVNNFLPSGETCGLPGNIGIDCAPDGTPYIFEALWKAGKMQLYKVVKENNTVVEYGPGLAIEISSSYGTTSDCAVFGINPVTGQFVTAIEEGASNTLKFKYLDENLAWNDFSYSFPVGNEKASIKEMAMDYAGNGTAYVAVRVSNNSGGNGVEGIHLFKIGLEDDILPE